MNLRHRYATQIDRHIIRVRTIEENTLFSITIEYKNEAAIPIKCEMVP